jgi:hypothetical protein
MITLEAATLAAQEFGSRNFPEKEGLEWGFLFRGISKSGLYLFQITVSPPAPRGRPRFGGSPGVVVDARSGDCRYVRGHSEYKDLLHEIAGGTS